MRSGRADALHKARVNLVFFCGRGKRRDRRSGTRIHAFAICLLFDKTTAAKNADSGLDMVTFERAFAQCCPDVINFDC
jgi:hypothetical protein